MPQTLKRGLGKAFDTLLPPDFERTLTEPSEQIQQLKPDKITPNDAQPRRHFDEEALKELAESIKRYGILQPLVVTPHGDGYMLIAGERRLRAAQIAGLDRVPAVVRSSKELERLEVALVENVQRVDLPALDQALSIERLHQQFNLTYESIAQRLGKAISTVHNIVRLLQLPEAAQNALQQGQITEGHARAVLALKDAPSHQTELLRLIIDKGWSVRQAERFVTAFKKGTPDTHPKSVQAKISSQTPKTKQLSKRLKTSVQLRRTAHGGKLEIDYSSDNELERIIDQLISSLG